MRAWKTTAHGFNAPYTDSGVRTDVSRLARSALSQDGISSLDNLRAHFLKFPSRLLLIRVCSCWHDDKHNNKYHLNEQKPENKGDQERRLHDSAKGSERHLSMLLQESLVLNVSLLELIKDLVLSL